jgi:Spy/CpxP family protein refolding chaperone
LRRPQRGWGAAALALLLAGTAASWAQAQPAMPRGGEPAGPLHAMHHRAGPGFGEAPWLSGRALDAVGASAEQKARVHDIFKAARDDLRKQRDEGRALHGQMLALLSAPQIDAAAAEALRQQQQARHDAASKRMLQAVLDAQAVLTPDQRQKLAERMKARHDLMERHWRERRALDAPPRS